MPRRSGHEQRRIVFARISDRLVAALGPALDDRDELAVMTGTDPKVLARVVEGVPRPLNARELAVVRRLAYLIAWDFDWPIVAIQTERVSYAHTSDEEVGTELDDSV